MTPEEQQQVEQLRSLVQASLAEGGVDDVRALVGNLLDIGASFHPTAATRPDLRRPRREDVVTLRVRIDLDHATPPIWRRLDLRSDLTLDRVHAAIQAAFGWTDSHLHRFSVGGDPFDWTSQLFLCPWDAEDPETRDDGVPESEVRLDELLVDAGDWLRYVYDYGDSWEHTIRLEATRPADEDEPWAVCLTGRRAAPPDDCGGVTDGVDLAMILADPGHFDVAEVNAALASYAADPRAVLASLEAAGVRDELVDLVGALASSLAPGLILPDTTSLAEDPITPSVDELREALRAHQWFLDRAAEDGIELTSAGYLRPADVESACRVVPDMDGWIGTHNREVHCVPLLPFRESLQRSGLLRKSKGRLLLTKIGAAAREDVLVLWRHLAARLVPDRTEWETDASVLLAAYADDTTAVHGVLGRVAQGLWAIGYAEPHGGVPDVSRLYGLDTLVTLCNVGLSDRAHTVLGARLSPVAVVLARTALRVAPSGQ